MRLQHTDMHHVWDNSIPPVITIEPGEVVELEVQNASGGQLDQTSQADALLGLDFARLNPVTGPVAVSGAVAGDTLVVDVLDIAVDGWGWTGVIPHFGLLSDDFTAPRLEMSAITDGVIDFLGRRLPAVPMIGTIGVAPREPGQLPMVPPHQHGGNMDIRHVTAGTRLRLPVGVDGALLSVGDTHAAMGDGEVCGTGIETGSLVTLRIGVEKAAPIPTAVLEVDGRAARTGPPW